MQDIHRGGIIGSLGDSVENAVGGATPALAMGGNMHLVLEQAIFVCERVTVRVGHETRQRIKKPVMPNIRMILTLKLSQSLTRVVHALPRLTTEADGIGLALVSSCNGLTVLLLFANLTLRPHLSPIVL